jgi:hypothetical protein
VAKGALAPSPSSIGSLILNGRHASAFALRATADAFAHRLSSPANRSGLGPHGARGILETSELASKILLNLAPFPFPAHEGNLVEYAQSVKQDADTPAQGDLEHPKIARVCDEIDDREEGDGDRILREVNMEPPQFSHLRQREGLIGADALVRRARGGVHFGIKREKSISKAAPSAFNDSMLAG